MSHAGKAHAGSSLRSSLALLVMLWVTLRTPPTPSQLQFVCLFVSLTSASLSAKWRSWARSVGLGPFIFKPLTVYVCVCVCV